MAKILSADLRTQSLCTISSTIFGLDFFTLSRLDVLFFFKFGNENKICRKKNMDLYSLCVSWSVIDMAYSTAISDYQ